MKKISLKARDNFFIVFFLLTFAVILFKLPYGFPGIDEAFYLTTPQRFAYGDAPIFEEWFVAQLYAFLVAPIYLIVRSVIGSSEGIYLIFRYVFVAAHSIACIIAYLKLRKYSNFAPFAIILWYAYMPLNIHTFSYNTIGLDASFLFCIFFFTQEKYSFKTFFMCGFLFAVLVLASPLVIAVYPLYLIIVISANIFYRVMNYENKHLPLEWKTFLSFSMGAALLAGIFFAFILTKCSLIEFIQSLQFLFLDPAYVNQSFLSYIKDFVNELLDFPKYAVIASLIASVAGAVDKNPIRKLIYFCLPAYFVIWYLLRLTITQGSNLAINATILPIYVMMFYCFFAIQNKSEIPKIAFYMIGWGGLYSLAIYCASDIKIYSLCTGFTLISAGSILIMGAFFTEIYNSTLNNGRNYQKILAVIVIGVLLGFQFSIQMYNKINYTYQGETGFSQFTEKITHGPMKGIISESETAEKYYSLLNIVDNNMPNENDKVLVQCEMWLYIYLEKEYGTYSAWNFTPNVYGNLDYYYEYHPEKLPEYILISRSGLAYGGSFEEIIERFKPRGFYVDFYSEEDAVLIMRR